MSCLALAASACYERKGIVCMLDAEPLNMTNQLAEMMEKGAVAFIIYYQGFVKNQNITLSRQIGHVFLIDSARSQTPVTLPNTSKPRCS